MPAGILLSLGSCSPHCRRGLLGGAGRSARRQPLPERRVWLAPALAPPSAAGAARGTAHGGLGAAGLARGFTPSNLEWAGLAHDSTAPPRRPATPHTLIGSPHAPQFDMSLAIPFLKASLTDAEYQLCTSVAADNFAGKGRLLLG